MLGLILTLWLNKHKIYKEGKMIATTRDTIMTIVNITRVWEKLKRQMKVTRVEFDCLLHKLGTSLIEYMSVVPRAKYNFDVQEMWQM